MAGQVAETPYLQRHCALFPQGVGLWAYGNKLSADSLLVEEELLMYYLSWLTLFLEQLNLKRTNHYCWYLDGIRKALLLSSYSTYSFNLEASPSEEANQILLE